MKRRTSARPAPTQPKISPAVWLLVALGLTVALKLPALDAPFDLDELLLLSGIDGDSLWMGSRFDLYRFSNGENREVQSLIDQGSLPWFTSTQWKYALWRPLTSLLFVVDHELFGDERVGYQLHSLLWWLALISAFAFLMFSLFERTIAGWAVLAFSVSLVHTESVVWLSARHTLVATTFGMAALAAHVHWREKSGRIRWRLASLLFLCGAFAASESAFQALAFLIAYEGIRALRARPGPRLALKAPLAVAIGYLLIYRLLDRGVREAFEYVDPLSRPGAFLERAADKMVILLVG